MSPFFLVLGTRYLHLNLKSEVGGPAKAMGFCGYGSGFEPRHSLQKRTSKWMSFFVLSNFDYWFFYSFSRLGLPARWGRYPLGVSFERAKETKTRLGLSPLSTPLGYQAVHTSRLGSARHACCGPCLCHHTRLPWAAGPITRWFPSPSLPWRSGVPAAESRAPDRWEQRHTRVRPWR